MKCGSAQGHGLNILQDVHCVWRTFTLLQQAKQHWRVMQSQRITKSEKPNDVMQISDFSHDTASASSMQSDTTVPSSASVTEQDTQSPASESAGTSTSKQNTQYPAPASSVKLAGKQFCRLNTMDYESNNFTLLIQFQYRLRSVVQENVPGQPSGSYLFMWWFQTCIFSKIWHCSIFHRSVNQQHQG